MNAVRLSSLFVGLLPSPVMS